MPLVERAPAKVNLSLQVLGRRTDGFHELDSIVAFAGCAADVVTLEPGPRLDLARVEGEFAGAAGPDEDNLVFRAATAAAARIEGLTLGSFSLTKRIPVAAGLGGGSADAAAALRLIARANGLESLDSRIVEAAEATGSDVPACLASRATRMTGRGEGLSCLDLPPVAAVLANPLKGLSTAAVFRALGLAPGSPNTSSGTGGSSEADVAAGPHCEASLARLLAAVNDLEPPARALIPEIGLGIDAIASSDGCRLARMSGSGATVFGLYDDQRAARRAARALRMRFPDWWIRPSMLR